MKATITRLSGENLDRVGGFPDVLSGTEENRSWPMFTGHNTFIVLGARAYFYNSDGAQPGAQAT